MVELLKQPQYTPFSMEREVVSVWAGTSGGLDDVPLEDIKRFEAEFLDYLARDKSEILTTIRETKDLSDDTVTLLESSLADFKRGFTTSEGTLLGHEAEAGALPDEEIEHGKVARKVRG